MPMTCRDLGPCVIEFDGVALPDVFESAILKQELTYAEIKNSINGETPVDLVTTGRKSSVETAFTNASYAQLQSLIHNSAVVSVSGSPAGVKTANSVGYAMGAGKADVVIKPYADGAASTNEAEWTTLKDAVFVEKMELPFNNKDQRTLAGVFVGLARSVATDPVVVHGYEEDPA